VNTACLNSNLINLNNLNSIINSNNTNNNKIYLNNNNSLNNSHNNNQNMVNLNHNNNNIKLNTSIKSDNNASSSNDEDGGNLIFNNNTINLNMNINNTLNGNRMSNENNTLINENHNNNYNINNNLNNQNMKNSKNQCNTVKQQIYDLNNIQSQNPYISHQSKSNGYSVKSMQTHIQNPNLLNLNSQMQFYGNASNKEFFSANNSNINKNPNNSNLLIGGNLPNQNSRVTYNSQNFGFYEKDNFTITQVQNNLNNQSLSLNYSNSNNGNLNSLNYINDIDNNNIVGNNLNTNNINNLNINNNSNLNYFPVAAENFHKRRNKDNEENGNFNNMYFNPSSNANGLGEPMSIYSGSLSHNGFLNGYNHKYPSSNIAYGMPGVNSGNTSAAIMNLSQNESPRRKPLTYKENYVEELLCNFN